MNYRMSTLHPAQTYTADKTEIIDINVADPISAIIFHLNVDNVGNVAPNNHALACLTKLELVDGSDVLFSLSGLEADALDWYHNGVTRSNWNAYRDGMNTDRILAINFGRYLWDPILALDPTKFTNLQLKFTLDIDAGGCAPENNTVRIYAALFDQKTITPEGFLMAKEIKDYAMGSATHEYTDLPTDYPYRKLLLRCQSHDHEPTALLSNLKLSEDQDKRVVFDHSPDEIIRNIMTHSPMYHETILCYAGASALDFFCTPTTRVFGTLTTWGQACILGELAFYDGDGGEFSTICATSSGNVQADVQGWLPHGVYDIHCGLQNEIEDWWDVTKIGSLRADILSAATAASTESVQIFLQQLRKYA